MARRQASSPWPSSPIPTSTGTLTFETVTARQALLILDGMESSYIDLDDPTHLEFEYMQQMDLALDAAAVPDRPRVLHLGGAGCALARGWASSRPGSAHVVIEWDAILADLAREYCDLPRSPALKIRVGEARENLEGFPDARFDVIVRDTFAGGAVPDHMRTQQVAIAASRVLTDDGVYLANLTDRPPLAMARSEVATMRSVFRHVLVVVDPAIVRGRRYGNLLLVCSDAPLDAIRLARGCRSLPMPASVLGEDDARAFAGSAPILLDA